MPGNEGQVQVDRCNPELQAIVTGESCYAEPVSSWREIMAIIYEPKGKAREYCALAANLYRGCQHGCSYCYVPVLLYRSRADFLLCEPRPEVIKALEKEAPAYRGKEVQLCFTCDPYPLSSIITREAIQIFHANGVRVRILTKAGQRSEGDFGLLAAHPNLSVYGATLTFIRSEDSQQWEPGAALPEERLAALEKAHALGIPTWASLEPIIDPEQTAQLIYLSRQFVDEYKVGRWNYDPRADAMDWRKITHYLKAVLDKYAKSYRFKKDLACYLPPK